MEKEEILEKSRNDNKGKDELEFSVIASAGRWAAQIGMIVCFIIAVLQVVFTGSISYESWMIYFGMLCSMFIVKYIKLHKKHELVLSIIYSALFILCTVLFVIRLVG